MQITHISNVAEHLQPTECTVRVLGDLSASDPAVSRHIFKLDRLFAVSPNGQWMVLARNRGWPLYEPCYTVSRTEQGAQEVIVPISQQWAHVRPRDIADDGAFLFEADLDEKGDDRVFSRRPVIFQPGRTGPVVLPPKYQPRDYTVDYIQDRRPLSHVAYYYTAVDKILGAVHQKRGQRGSHEDGMRHCVWRCQPSGQWAIDYLPDCTNALSLQPASPTTFVACDRVGNEEVIHFHFFDGTAVSTYPDIALEGVNAHLSSVASDGAMLGQVTVYNSKSEGKPRFLQHAFLINPHAQIGYVLDCFDAKAWLPKMSANGQYVTGWTRDGGQFLMKVEGGGFRYALLTARDWRIAHTMRVTDEGSVFALATCTERLNDYYRLQLPVLLTPQW